MMCGCPIQKDGLWDSNLMEVRAVVQKDGEAYTDVLLDNPGQNIFEGNLAVKESGYYQITVYAYNSKTGNTGVDKINYVVRD